MRILDWGLVEYESSVARQLEELEAVFAGAEDALIVCTHPPVVTLGRATSDEDIHGWTGAQVASSRGGRATYHGPSQVVLYPIVNLTKRHQRFAARDIHAYLHALENAVVAALHELGLSQAEARAAEVGGISLTGVWAGERKIASIGIAVRKWVSYHGVAINVLNDPLAFSGIRPCGFAPGVMTSLEQEMGRALDFESVKGVFVRSFRRALQAETACGERASGNWETAAHNGGGVIPLFEDR